jgi:DNA replication licensing factor MCM4
VNASGSGAANGAEESDGGATPKASGMTVGGNEAVYFYNLSA